MISLKKAEFSDIEFLWYLRNQPDVYRYSKEEREVSWPEHINWIIPVLLGTSGKNLFIIKKGRLPAGQIRFDYEDDEKVKISIAILKHFRGEGIGTGAFKKAIRLLKKTKKLKIISAEVHQNNIASQKFFEKLNFKSGRKEGIWLKYILNL